MNEQRKSLHFLDKIISLEKRDNHDLFSNEIENAYLIKDCIEKGDYNRGISQILQWQDQTVKAIGLKIK